MLPVVVVAVGSGGFSAASSFWSRASQVSWHRAQAQRHSWRMPSDPNPVARAHIFRKWAGGKSGCLVQCSCSRCSATPGCSCSSSANSRFPSSAQVEAWNAKAREAVRWGPPRPRAFPSTHAPSAQDGDSGHAPPVGFWGHPENKEREQAECPERAQAVLGSGSHPAPPPTTRSQGHDSPPTCLKKRESFSASASRCRRRAKALEKSVSWACRARKRAPAGPSSAASQPASGCRNFSARLTCSWRQSLGSARLGLVV